MFNDETVCGEASAKVDGHWATTILKRVRRLARAWRRLDLRSLALSPVSFGFAWKTTLADCACQTTPHHP